MLEKIDDNWWYGLCNGSQGQFPARYVERLTQVARLARPPPPIPSQPQAPRFGNASQQYAPPPFPPGGKPTYSNHNYTRQSYQPPFSGQGNTLPYYPPQGRPSIVPQSNPPSAVHPAAPEPREHHGLAGRLGETVGCSDILQNQQPDIILCCSSQPLLQEALVSVQVRRILLPLEHD